MARPRANIDGGLVEVLASRGLTNREIAECWGCTARTLERRFGVEMRRGRQNLRMSIRVRQLRSAMKGCAKMLMHLGCVYLGQSHKVQHEIHLEFQPKLRRPPSEREFLRALGAMRICKTAKA
jgi:hypothetical protein